MEFRSTDPIAEVPFSSDLSADKVAALQSQFDRKRRANQIIVPTDDGRVRTRLRELKEPITLFGEGPVERRDRLRELLTQEIEKAEAAALDDDGDVPITESEPEEVADGAEEQEEFYTEGTDLLLKARQDIAKFSLRRAQHKIEFQKMEATIPKRTHVAQRNEIKERLSGIELYGSQVASDRPVSIVRFSPSGDYVAAGNWGGSVKLLDVPNLDEKKLWRGHSERVGGVSWYPNATVLSSTVSADSVNLASGGGDGLVQLWSLNSEQPLSTLRGHNGRVCRVEFHPSGSYLGSAGYDSTWRLWDVKTSTELLLQEGHSREVYAITFNGDGSLVASAGLDAIGRIWDLRTGRTVMLLEGHQKEIFAAHWATDSHRLMTGGADGLAIAWDLRMVREVGRVPAHSKGVTDLRWFEGTDGPASGKLPKKDKATGEVQPKKSATFVVTCGFDKQVNIWSALDWVPCNTLSGHSGIVLSTDVDPSGRYIASCGHDRSVKLWTREDMQAI